MRKKIVSLICSMGENFIFLIKTLLDCLGLNIVTLLGLNNDFTNLKKERDKTWENYKEAEKNRSQIFHNYIKDLAKKESINDGNNIMYHSNDLTSKSLFKILGIDEKEGRLKYSDYCMLLDTINSECFRLKNNHQVHNKTIDIIIEERKWCLIRLQATLIAIFVTFI